MTTRTEQIELFLTAADWQDAERFPLQGDASRRRYTRLRRPDGLSVMLMDAPPDAGEDVRPFIHMSECLTEFGLSAPEIVAADDVRGFLLLEDLGDDVFARVLEKSPGLETELYQAATDVLITLHQKDPPDLEHYNAAMMAELSAKAFDWYQLGALGQTQDKDLFQELMQRLLLPLEAQRRVVVQRDYHAENLIWLPNREGIRRVGLLDYQDAMQGHPAYDLVSVLRDARRDVSTQTEQAMLNDYVAKSGLDADEFKAAYAVLGVQRNVRILFIFARMCMAFGKPHYVDLIPRVWAHIMDQLDRPDLETLGRLIKSALPAPTPDILQRIKDQCGTHPLP